MKRIKMECLNVQLQRHGSGVGEEVERSRGRGTQPCADVLCIGEGGGQRDDADRVLELGGHVAHPRADHLQDRLR